MKGYIRHLDHEKTLSLEHVVDACVQTQHERYKEILYKRFYGYLLAIALRYVKNREDAEELVNECFVKVFFKLHTFSGKSYGVQYEKLFKGWLARICVNLSIDFLRKKKMMLNLDDQPEYETAISPLDSSNNLLVEDIMKLMSKLSDIQRTIFNLYEVEGYSHEEIAEKLEIPASTSRTYLMRAKEHLKALYRLSDVALRKMV